MHATVAVVNERGGQSAIHLDFRGICIVLEAVDAASVTGERLKRREGNCFDRILFFLIFNDVPSCLVEISPEYIPRMHALNASTVQP